MVKNILVCIDGSASSEETTLTAIKIARERNACLVGMVIIHEPEPRRNASGGEFGCCGNQSDRPQRRCLSEGVVARVIEAVGRPAESILHEMEHHDLMVMGRDANFRFETEREDASTRDKILRHATHPVLLIPESHPETPASLGQTVLVAYDGSEPSEHALASFAGSGLAESREVHVATIGDDGGKAWDITTSAVGKLRSFGITAFTHNVVSLLPTSAALVELGRELGAGLLVMGTFARSRWAKLLHGSGTRDIVEHSSAPLCLQH